MKPRSVVRLFYGFQFFFSLLLWAPIFYEYQREMGLTDEQIFGIQSFYYLSFCFLEIPTGYVSDRWGHRTSLALGAGILTGANLLPIFLPDYYGFALHWLLVAVARSLISGAASAYIYDYLAENGEPGWYKQAEGRARAFSLVGRVAGWAAVGFLMQWHLTLPYWLTAGASALSVGFALALPGFSDRGDRPAATMGFGRAFRLLVSSRYLILVMLQGVAIFVLARVVQVNLFQPLLQQKGFPVWAYGVLMGGTTLFEALGSGRPEWINRWFSDLNGVFVLTLLLAGSTWFMAGAGPVATVIWLTLFALAVGLAYPVQRQVVNDAIPDSSFRATFLSIESLLDRLVCAAAAATMGGYVAAGLVGEFFQLSALVSLGAIAVLWALLWRSGPPLSLKEAEAPRSNAPA